MCRARRTVGDDVVRRQKSAVECGDGDGGEMEVRWRCEVESCHLWLGGVQVESSNKVDARRTPGAC
jgi:hypothetical protein